MMLGSTFCVKCADGCEGVADLVTVDEWPWCQREFVDVPNGRERPEDDDRNCVGKDMSTHGLPFGFRRYGLSRLGALDIGHARIPYRETAETVREIEELGKLVGRRCFESQLNKLANLMLRIGLGLGARNNRRVPVQFRTCLRPACDVTGAGNQVARRPRMPRKPRTPGQCK